jgi:hypothetical protein
MTARWHRVAQELGHHLPYTIVGSLLAMAGVWWFGAQQLGQGRAEALVAQANTSFHLAHPLHVCLSAIATTSLFWRFERHLLRALAVGVIGTILPCGLSDYLMPYLGGLLLGQPMTLHMCLVDHPQLFFPFLGLGLIGGFWAEERLAASRVFSHGAHIFISSVASLLYLISFGFTAWMSDVRFVFPVLVIIVLAVWVPCCISDIVVPAAVAQAPAGSGGHGGACAH